VAWALCMAGDAHADRGESVTAAELYEEALSLLKGSSNRILGAIIRMSVGDLAAASGDYATARDILVECVATARAEGDLWLISANLDSLAAAQLGLAHHRAAAASWKEALSISRTRKNLTGAWYSLAGLSCVAGAGGDDQRALRLAAAANRLADEWSLPLPPPRPKVLEESERRARSRLGMRKSEEAWNHGWSMSIDQAIDYALAESDPETVIDAGPLTRREREVAKLVAAGLTNRQIAERLFIAERSAEGHVERIRNKLGVRSRTEVATWAVEHGLMTASMKERGTPNGPLSTRRRQPS
jgi:DNA-binding CsgD family transcriptional regulator